MTALSRPGLSVLRSTWKALFLRETVNRLSAGRAAWVWLLVEPMVHVFFMLAMFTLVRVTAVGGIDVTVWLTIGMLSFFLFRRTANQCANAIGANRALFTYRQVKPVDTVLVRAATEGFLMLLVITLAVIVLALLGHRVAPADPLELIGALLGLWLVGLGYGLIASVGVELIPELAAYDGPVPASCDVGRDWSASAKARGGDWDERTQRKTGLARLCYQLCGNQPVS